MRIWERRYKVVEPYRSDNADRLYHRDDINRLTLLKMLVDRGHTIGSIVKFNNDELTERLEVHDHGKSFNINDSNGSSISVVVVGSVLPLQIEHSDIDDSSFCFSGLYKNKNEFEEKHVNKTTDILVLEYPTIQEDQIDDIHGLFKSSGAKKLILIYGFSNSAAKRFLKDTDYVFIHAPITIDHLHAEIKHQIEEENLYKDNMDNLELGNEAPKRTYSNKHLIQLASASSTIKCECPQHLSAMIIKLVQFEVYSSECENRSKKDAELHKMLGNMTGHARFIMEQALTKVVEAEGIKID